MKMNMNASVGWYFLLNAGGVKQLKASKGQYAIVQI